MYLQSYYHVGALIYLPLQVLKGHSPLVKYVPLYEIDKQKVSGAPSGALIQSVSLPNSVAAVSDYCFAPPRCLSVSVQSNLNFSSVRNHRVPFDGRCVCAK